MRDLRCYTRVGRGNGEPWGYLTMHMLGCAERIREKETRTDKQRSLSSSISAFPVVE